MTLVLGEQAKGSVCLPAASLYPLPQLFIWTPFLPRTRRQCSQSGSRGWAGALTWQVTRECAEASLPFGRGGRGWREESSRHSHSLRTMVMPRGLQNVTVGGEERTDEISFTTVEVMDPFRQTSVGADLSELPRERPYRTSGVDRFAHRKGTIPACFPLSKCVKWSNWFFSSSTFRVWDLSFWWVGMKGQADFRVSPPRLFPKGARASDVQASPPWCPRSIEWPT